MNEKFNKNAKVEKITNMLGIAVRLIVIDPFICVPFDYISSFNVSVAEDEIRLKGNNFFKICMG